MLCSELTEVNLLEDTAFISPLPCKRWSCEYCRPNRTRQLIAQAIDGNPNKFITLTCNPAEHASPEEAARALIRTFRKFRRKAMKVYGYKKFPFLSVIEVTKKGWPHLHILARVAWIDQRFLSDYMAAEINAPIVDIRKVDGTRAVSRYVAKYIGKAPMKIGTLKRYWRSRDWEQRTAEEIAERKRPKGTTYVSREKPGVLAGLLEQAGWRLNIGHTDIVAFRTLHATDPPWIKQLRKSK